MAIPRYITKPLFWVGSILAAILAPLLLLAVVVVGVEVALHGDRIVNPTTEGDVEALIHQELELGATYDEIVAFLDRHEIEYGEIGLVREDSKLAGYPGSTEYIGAIVRDTSWYPLGDVYIQIYFILDGNRRLEEYFAREGSTSL